MVRHSICLVMLFQAVSMAAPTASELIDKCTQTLDKTHTSFITQSKTHIHDKVNYGDQYPANMNLERDKFLMKEFRTDGDRFKIITQMWYDANANFANSEEKKQYSSDTYDGKKRYDHVRPYDNPGRVTIFDRNTGKSAVSLDVQFAYMDPVSQSFGYLIGDVERFDRILKKADPGKVSVKEDKLNGTLHYLIEADTDHGRYKIWLNPEKGYNFSRAIVVRKAGDTHFGEYTVKPGTSKRAVVENTEFKEIDGLWVPTKTKSKMNDTLPNKGFMKSDYEIELISILINPDHDALDSFSVKDIKDGAKANIHGMPRLYTWQNGELIPNTDKTADEIPAKGKH